MTSKKRAACYARFSSDLQKDRSVDDQLAACRQYAAREGLTVAAEFCDRAKSGASLFDRDGLFDLMKQAKAGAFDAVIVESLDRLSRDQEDLAGMFKRLSFHNVEIRTLNEGIASSIHVGIRGLVGSLFLADMGNKIRRGHNGRVREGKFPGAVTYGYRRILGKPGEREIDETQAKVVRRIFREYAEGRSPRDIAKRLTAEGIPSPSGKGAWNMQTFVGGRHRRGMISNDLYVGRIVWNARRTVLDPDKGTKIKRAGKPEDRLEAAAPHLRIISDDLWNAAQAVRKGRACAKFGPEGKVIRRPVIARSPQMLNGLLRCGACNGPMRISNTSRDGTSRVACAAAHQHGTCSHSKTYDLGKLETGILEGLKGQLTDPAAIAEAAKAYHTRWAERSRDMRQALDADRRGLTRIEIQIDRLVDAIANGGGAVKPLAAKLGELETERVALTERIRLGQAGTNIVDLHPGAIESYRANVSKLHGAMISDPHGAATKAAFRNLIDCIVVHPTGKRMPYEFTPYGRLAALMDVDLFPSQRKPREILAEQGIPYSDPDNPEKADLSKSQQNVIALGRWRAAA
jgi:site-specific DNA recombinase